VTSSIRKLQLQRRNLHWYVQLRRSDYLLFLAKIETRRHRNPKGCLQRQSVLNIRSIFSLATRWSSRRQRSLVMRNSRKDNTETIHFRLICGLSRLCWLIRRYWSGTTRLKRHSSNRRRSFFISFIFFFVSCFSFLFLKQVCATEMAVRYAALSVSL